MCRLLRAPLLVVLLALSGAATAMRSADPWRLLHITTAVSADLDGDGALDLAEGHGALVGVRFSGGRTLRLAIRSRVEAVTAFDIDADGDHDLVALSSRDRLHVWRNDGTGRFVRQRGGLAAHANRAGDTRSSLDAKVQDDSTGSAFVEDRSAFIVPHRLLTAALDRAGPVIAVLADLRSTASARQGSPRAPPSQFSS